MVSGKTLADDSEEESCKSVEMEADIDTEENNGSQPSSPESEDSDSIISSSPSDLSLPLSKASRNDLPVLLGTFRSQVIPRPLVPKSETSPLTPISIPRTVPCIVLSPNELCNQQSLYTTSPTLLSLSPDSIMSKMSKLSNSVQGSFRLTSGTGESEARERKTIQLHDSLKQIIQANNITGEAPTCDRSSEERNNVPGKTISKQLAFGIDRILGDRKDAFVHKGKGCTWLSSFGLN
jgi:hypothetical protein